MYPPNQGEYTRVGISLECTMFHEVKIFDKKGKVKKVLSSKKLSNKYWDSFFHNPLSEAMKKKKGRGRKSEADVNFDDEDLDSSKT